MTEAERKSMKILVLCIDRDDDLGIKTGVKSPVVGKEKVLEAAIKLIMNDPEEADANAMFEAVRIMNSLKSKDKSSDYEVAVLTGSKNGGIEADRRISESLRETLRIYPADAAILVSDGYTDQEISPIIQSQVPIISVRRFAVKHSESIETSWYILTRYLSMLIQDPRYTKWTLGIPGLIVLSLSILYMLALFYPEIPLIPYTLTVILMVVGLTLFIKGFGVDKSISYIVSEVSSKPSILIRVFGYVVCFIMCGLGFSQGSSSVIANVPVEKLTDIQSFINFFNIIVASFIEGVLGFFLAGFLTLLISKAIYDYINRSLKFLGDIVGIVSVAMIFGTIANSVPLIKAPPTSIFHPTAIAFFFWVILATALIVTSTLIAHKSRDRFMKIWRAEEA
jgi:putative membrane protein